MASLAINLIICIVLVLNSLAVDAVLCHGGCKCNDANNLVDCSNTAFSSIPSTLSVNTKTLILKRSQLQIIKQSDLEIYKNLEYYE